MKIIRNSKLYLVICLISTLLMFLLDENLFRFIYFCLGVIYGISLVGILYYKKKENKDNG